VKKASGARRDRRDSEYEGDGISSASRILWALAGVVAYVAAKYFFGF
jgi:hypothetical protein